MNKSIFAWLCGAMVCFFCQAQAQAEPLVRVPDWLSCVVTAVDHGNQGEAKSPGPKAARSDITPRVAEIERDDKLLHVYITWSGGHKSELWRLRENKVTFFADQNRSVRIRRGHDLIPDILHMESTETWISWISVDCLLGTETVRGQECNHYSKMITITNSAEDGPDGGPAFIQVRYQAWIARETLLPVSFDNGDARYEISFRSPPPSRLVPPAFMQTEMARMMRLLRAPKHL